MSNKSGKTPYEIRLELLELAFNVLVHQHQAAGVANANNVTTAPKTEDVIAEAEKMNAFISRGNQSN
jgi:hypothetical protein